MNAARLSNTHMKPVSLVLLIAAIAVLSYARESTAESVALPEPLKTALAQRSVQQFQYRIRFRNNDLRGSAQVDPSQPAGGRVRLHGSRSVDSDELKEILATIESSVSEGIWCDRLAERIGNPITVAAESDTEITYHFQPLADHDANRSGRKIVQQLRGEVIVSKTNSAALRFRVYSVQPFKPAFYATITRMQEQVVCEIGPDGRSFSAFESTKVTGTALGIGFEEYLELRISALTPLR